VGKKVLEQKLGDLLFIGRVIEDFEEKKRRLFLPLFI